MWFPGSLVLALSRLLMVVTIAFRPRLPMLSSTIGSASGFGLPGASRYLDLMCGAVASGGFSAKTFHLPRLPGPQGFLLHSVTRFLRPCLLSSTRESVTLCPIPASGSPYRGRFPAACGSHSQQDRRISLGKTHRLPRYRPASHWFGPPDIRSRSLRPARPPPQRHIAGSLFATYPGSASCFLRAHHL